MSSCTRRNAVAAVALLVVSACAGDGGETPPEQTAPDAAQDAAVPEEPGEEPAEDEVDVEDEPGAGDAGAGGELVASCTIGEGTVTDAHLEATGDPAPGADLAAASLTTTDDGGLLAELVAHDPIPESTDLPVGIFWHVHIASTELNERIQVGAALDGTQWSTEWSQWAGSDFGDLDAPEVDGDRVTFEIPAELIPEQADRWYAGTEYMDDDFGQHHDVCPGMDDWVPAQPEELPLLEPDAEATGQLH